MFVHYCFVFSCLIGIFFYLSLRRQESKGILVLGMVCITFFSYLLSYEYPVSEINCDYLVVFYPLVISFVLIILTSATNVADSPGCKNKNGFFVVCLIATLCFQMLSLVFIYGIPWIKNTFMVDNAEAVVFTLKTSKQGAWNVVLESFSKEVFKPSFSHLFLGIASFLALLLFVYVPNKKIALSVCKKKIFFERKRIFENLFFGNLALSVIWGSLAIMSVPIIWNSAVNIYKAYTKEGVVVKSELYKTYYVSPDSVQIKFPSKPKNLIFIMLESMGVEHIKALEELKVLQEENVSFLPGGESIAMQGWTIGSQIAKYCGVPLKFPVYDSIQVFLPNAFCIQDLLDKNGYRQLFVQGTDKKFSSFGYFIETHSNVEMHDFLYYEKTGQVGNAKSGWGIDDSRLFELLKEELDKMPDNQPFAVYSMTMDTHWPMGFVGKNCDIGTNDLNDKSGTYRTALKCSSKYVKEFLDWAKTKKWFDNTLIVIQGDHIIPKTLRNLLSMPPSDSSKYWYNVFINAPKPENVYRNFSAFDIYPTIVEMMGAKLGDGHRLALGTSLLSKEKTLLEILGRIKLDSLLMLNDEMDLYFMGINK